MKVTRQTLKNGIRTIIIELPDSEVVSTSVFVGAGGRYETPETFGISHFLEHMAFKGTKKYPKPEVLNSVIESVGGVHNAETEIDYTRFFNIVPKEKISVSLDVLSDQVSNLLLPKKEMDKERGVITEEINMYYDDPKEIPLLKLGGVLWPGQPMSSDLLGTKEIIRRLQPQDLRLYMNTYYKTENLVLSVAGGIKAEKILLGLEKTFSKVSQGKKKQPEKVIENQKERKIKVFFKDSDQAHAVLAYRTFSYSDKRKYILDVFSTLFGVGLGSILHHEIREKRGLAYYADASSLYATDCGTLIIRAGFNKDKVGEALGVVKTELNKAKRELYIQKRINRAKELIKGIFKIRLERAEGLSDWYGKRELLSPEIPEPKEIAGLIDKVTAEEIKTLANDIFKDDLENLVIVGPYKDKARFEKALKSR
jgi:predicted Zn-dependent peptidase